MDPVDADHLVMAEYLPWWYGAEGWGATRDNTGWLDDTPSTPVLGEYRSDDPDVANQHIKWAVEYGIEAFVVNLGEPGGPNDHITRNTLMDAELADHISFYSEIAIPGNYQDQHGNVDFSSPEVRSELARRLQHRSDEYFGRDNYLETDDGRPLLYYYNAGNPQGDIVGAWEEAKDTIPEDPYLIAYLMVALGPGNPLGITPAADNMAVYDAINPFNPFAALASVSGRDAATLDDILDSYHDWAVAASDYDTAFVPTVLPGFDETEKDPSVDDRDYLPVWERDPDRYTEFCDRALDYIDPDLDAVFINGFNGWIEDTQIEPGESYGTTYLEITRDHLALGTPDRPPIDDYVSLELRFDRTATPEGTPDGVDLAFMLDGISVSDGAKTLATYTATPAAEQPPVFVDGAYPPTEKETRWLGGPDARARIALGPETTNASHATITGYPIEPGITADVYVEGERTDQVTFDQRGVRSYTVSLQSGGEATS